MKTKVTFSFEDELVEEASRFARSKHTSVRSIIRKFLADLARENRFASMPSKQKKLVLPTVPTGDIN